MLEPRIETHSHGHQDVMLPKLGCLRRTRVDFERPTQLFPNIRLSQLLTKTHSFSQYVDSLDTIYNRVLSIRHSQECNFILL